MDLIASGRGKKSSQGPNGASTYNGDGFASHDCDALGNETGRCPNTGESKRCLRADGDLGCDKAAIKSRFDESLICPEGRKGQGDGEMAKLIFRTSEQSIRTGIVRELPSRGWTSIAGRNASTH